MKSYNDEYDEREDYIEEDSCRDVYEDLMDWVNSHSCMKDEEHVTHYIEASND